MPLLLLTLLAADPADWKKESAPDGVTLESRPVKDSPFFEYRSQADAPDVSVDALCDAVFEWGSVSKDHEGLQSRTLIADSGESRIVYDRLDPPVVSSRDFAFTVQRERLEDGSCRLSFFATNGRAPPKPDGWVRIEKLRGGWLFQPKDKGSHVTYTLWADPAGSIPPVFIHGSQRDAAVNTIKKGIVKGRVEQEKKTRK